MRLRACVLLGFWWFFRFASQRIIVFAPFFSHSFGAPHITYFNTFSTTILAHTILECVVCFRYSYSFVQQVSLGSHSHTYTKEKLKYCIFLYIPALFFLLLLFYLWKTAHVYSNEKISLCSYVANYWTSLSFVGEKKDVFYCSSSRTGNSHNENRAQYKLARAVRLRDLFFSYLRPHDNIFCGR